MTTDGRARRRLARRGAQRGARREPRGVLWTRSRSLAETTAGGETELVWGEAELPERLGELDLLISPRRSSRRTPRWPSCCTAWSSSTPPWRAGSACTTCTAGSARSRSRSRRARASCGGSSWSSRPSPTRSPARGATGSPTPTSSPATPAWRCPSCCERAGRPDVVVVDPPRAGLSKKVVHRIIDASPKRIVYVSCNPTTLAPNAAELVRGRVGAAQGAPGGHVPADPPHRVRRAARARRAALAAGSE